MYVCFKISEMSEDDYAAQAFSFLAAGFETSSSTMSFALYELAKHPDIQNRLREEICETLQKHNYEVTYDGIQEMKYLDMVVNGENYTSTNYLHGLRNPDIQCRIHKGFPIIPNLTRINPIPRIDAYLF